MARQPLIRSSTGVYHVTSRSNNREWFDLPLSLMWQLFAERIGPLADRHAVQLHAFVLMANHFHMMISTPALNLDEFTRELLTGVSKAVGRCSNRINHVFGGRYKWSLLTNSFHAGIVHRYVLRNPVRAGICERVEDYRYSTASRVLEGVRDFPIVERLDPLWRFARLPEAARLQWLNTAPPSEQEELIRKGLRRFEFALSKNNNDRASAEALKSSYIADFWADDRDLLSLEVE